MDAWQSLSLLRDSAKREKPRWSERQRVRPLLADIGALTLFGSTTTFWRGHSNADYRLTPRLARDQAGDVRTRVESLLEEQERASHLWREGVTLRGLTELERLALLQHTGTATPLLDLTADPLVALYFAARDHPLKSGKMAHGLLIGWNAVDWVDLRHKGDETERKPSYWSIVEDLRKQHKVGWIAPPVVNDRIVVQRSRLLVAPLATDEPENRWYKTISDLVLPPLPKDWGETPLANLFKEEGGGRLKMPPVVAFRVPRDLKRFVRGILERNYGISHLSLFPEAAGFAQRPAPGSGAASAAEG